MCGIGVILDPARRCPVERLLALHAPIRHRGPDGEGFLIVSDSGTHRFDDADAIPAAAPLHVGMAFRRLKILDLSTSAAQPMKNADGSLWIAYNGEIYNFRDLRAELESRGRVFHSSGDTEVALAAYEQWGERAFERFEGMWAIVILDLRKRRLVISRDRFGIKPLYWMIADGALLLASEIKQFHVALGRRPAPNLPLVTMFLRNQRYPYIEETFFEGVYSVPPATWAMVDIDAPVPTPQFTPYWSLADFTTNGHPPLYESAREAVEEKLTAAVSSHLVSDVRLGALLSGGLDSATLVGLLANRVGTRLPTFSLGYREAAPKFCELRFVDAMVKRDGLMNYETTLDYEWVKENIDRVLWTLEEPPLAMPALAQYRVFELCRQHGATVILDGQGSDEITGGYQYHQHAFLKDRLLRRKPIAFARELGAIARAERRSRVGVFNEFFIAPRFRKKPKYDWIADPVPRANAQEFIAAAGDYGRDSSLVNRQLYFDVRWGNVKIILGYGDRSAMAHSIEARVPYFDRAFVELLFTLPDHYKIRGGERKKILRDVARRYVPAEITERTDRMGFGTPDEEMIRGPLWADIKETILDRSFLSTGVVRADRIRELILDFERGVAHDYRAIWRPYALARWARRFDIAF